MYTPKHTHTFTQTHRDKVAVVVHGVSIQSDWLVVHMLMKNAGNRARASNSENRIEIESRTTVAFIVHLALHTGEQYI